MIPGLDAKIKEVDQQRRMIPDAWEQKHLPVRYGGRIYWLTLEVPAEMADVLAHLPQQREDASEQRRCGGI